MEPLERFRCNGFSYDSGRVRQVAANALLLASLASVAQEAQVHIVPDAPAGGTTLAYSQDQAQQPSPAAKTILTVPANQALVAPVRWISLKHPAWEISQSPDYLPVHERQSDGVPPGTYVQGIVEKITRHYKHSTSERADALRRHYLRYWLTVTIPGQSLLRRLMRNYVTDSPNGQSVPALSAAQGATFQ